MKYTALTLSLLFAMPSLCNENEVKRAPKTKLARTLYAAKGVGYTLGTFLCGILVLENHRFMNRREFNSWSYHGRGHEMSEAVREQIGSMHDKFSSVGNNLEFLHICTIGTYAYLATKFGQKAFKNFKQAWQ